MAKLLRSKAREIYPAIQDRLPRLEVMAEGIGRGYGDYLRDEISSLDEALG